MSEITEESHLRCNGPDDLQSDNIFAVVTTSTIKVHPWSTQVREETDCALYHRSTGLCGETGKKCINYKVRNSIIRYD